jgi:hypothetical protein
MAYIVFIAMLLAIYALQTGGVEKAFLRVWIPIFLIMPTMFWVNIPGLPDPNFAQAAILPILAVLLAKQGSRMSMGRMEWLIAAYLVVRVVADFLGRGYADAQNYAFYMLSALVGPFLLGRYVIDSRRMDIAAARAIVLMFLIFFPMFVYELKAWVSPIYKMFSPFFPNAFSGLSIRWGIARTAGTFEHPILACVMVTAAYRLHRWLAWNGEWTRQQTGMLGWWQKRTAKWPLSLQTQISFALVAMALMTISRGPWIGGLVAAMLVAAGNRPNRKSALVWVGAGLLVCGIAGKMALDAYTTPEMGEVLSGEAKTMVYRKEMVERYKEFLLERTWTGWGLTKVPKIRGMESIDNAFFLMALQHGVIAPTLFTLIFLYAILSQLKFGLKAPPGQPPIGFTFSGIYLMCFISFLTVYMGAQTEPLLFLLLGWGESIKRRSAEDRPTFAGEPTRQRSSHPFRRVLR